MTADRMYRDIPRAFRYGVSGERLRIESVLVLSPIFVDDDFAVLELRQIERVCLLNMLEAFIWS